ncbi:sulfatase, partial [bacterium]|nr:sulfatase [bacterium]
MSTKTQRVLSIALRILAVLAFLVAIQAGLQYYTYRQLGIDLDPMLRCLEEVRERASETQEKAQGFDQSAALRELGQSRDNGFLYRFDDHLADAEFPSREASPSEKIDPYLLRWEFDGDDSVGIGMEIGSSQSKDGLLVLTWPGQNSHLQTMDSVELERSDVGALHLRMRQIKGRTASLSWGTDPSTIRAQQPGRGVLTIHTIPGSQFQTYEIDLTAALFQERVSGDTIRRIFFRPSDVEGDQVEIDYIRFVSRRAAYAVSDTGAGYQTLGDETRRVLFVNTPYEIDYMVDIPNESVSLETGLGVLLADAPTSFQVFLTEDDRTTTLLSQWVDSTSGWQDAAVDLSHWKGKRLRLRFSAEGEGSNVAFWANPQLRGTPRNRFNVVIVLEDALRADRMSCYGFERPTTPEKAQLVGKGVQFHRAYSQAVGTRMSVSSFMTSLYPTATGVWDHTEMLSDSYLTLAEILRYQGFATASFFQNDNAGLACGVHQGFSRLFDARTVGERAEGMYGEVLENWLDENQNRNFFLYLHLVDPHGPYDPPKPFDQWYHDGYPGATPMPKYGGFDPDWVEYPTAEGRRDRYDGEIAYNDSYLPSLMKMFDERDLNEETLFIFIADHGEHLGEHGYWNHAPPGYVQVLHVPLIMVYPRALPRGLLVSQTVQLLDLAPTILDLAGIATDDFLMEGVSLLPLIRGERLEYWACRPAISEEVTYLPRDKSRTGQFGSLFYKQWHFLNSAEFSGFNLTQPENLPRRTFLKVFNQGTDRQEQVPLQNWFLSRLYDREIKPEYEWIQSSNLAVWKALTGGERSQVLYDPEAQKRLENLGYVGG